MNSEGYRMIDEILEFLWVDSPVWATYLGIHKYDGELDRLGPDHRTHSITKKKEYRHKIEDFLQNNPDLLSSDEKLDLTILKKFLSVDIELQEKLKRVMRDATFYPEIALYGIYLIYLREYAPLEIRAQSILSRLRQIPRLLEEGKENLRHGDNIPKLWTEMAMEITQNGQSFFSNVIPFLADQLLDLKEDLISTNNAVQNSMEDYLNFLKTELINKSNGQYHIGRNLFQYLIDNEHQLPYSMDHLVEMGEDILRQTQEKIYRLSRGINSFQNWRDIINEAKNEYPPCDGLIGYYQNISDEIKQFIIDKNLVTIPENQKLTILETPVFERSTIPYAAYIPPAPFNEKQEGYFWITPVDVTKTEIEQQEQKKGHSIFSIPITVLHEAYPGHHTQFCHANRINSKVRKIFKTDVFVEGWALYCEELMWEHGYYIDSRTRLMQLRDLLWRACRVIIDVKLHTGDMSFDDAVKMLVETAGLEKINAISEVKRYTQSPTQPMSYLAGKMEILKLRSDCKTKETTNFSLKDFHDRLLSYGSIPLNLIRKEMLGE